MKTVNCVKLGYEAEALERAPVPGELGQKILENVSKEAWEGWIQYQTMLINENLLNLADQRARNYLFQQMQNYFFGPGADTISGYKPKT